MRYGFAYLTAFIISLVGIFILLGVVALYRVAPPPMGPIVGGQMEVFHAMGAWAVYIGGFLLGVVIIGLGQLIDAVVDTAQNTRRLVEVMKKGA